MLKWPIFFCHVSSIKLKARILSNLLSLSYLPCIPHDSFNRMAIWSSMCCLLEWETLGYQLTSNHSCITYFTWVCLPTWCILIGSEQTGFQSHDSRCRNHYASSLTTAFHFHDAQKHVHKLVGQQKWQWNVKSTRTYKFWEGNNKFHKTHT